MLRSLDPRHPGEGPQGQKPRRRSGSWRRDGSKFPGVIVHGAPEGWFLPGAGKTEWFQDFEGGPEMAVVPAGSFHDGVDPSEIDALVRNSAKILSSCQIRKAPA